MGISSFVKKQFIDVLQWTEAGDDVLVGWAGNDLLWGGAGVDLLDHQLANAAVTVRLDLGTVHDGMGGIDEVGGIENLIGSAFGDALTGDSQANLLVGYYGNDLLIGNSGRVLIDDVRVWETK